MVLVAMMLVRNTTFNKLNKDNIMNNNFWKGDMIQTYSESSLNIISDTANKLKQMFKEVNKIESHWAVFDEATGEYVSSVEYD